VAMCLGARVGETDVFSISVLPPLHFSPIRGGPLRVNRGSEFYHFFFFFFISMSRCRFIDLAPTNLGKHGETIIFLRAPMLSQLARFLESFFQFNSDT
jgi:hypothetical protein